MVSFLCFKPILTERERERDRKDSTLSLSVISLTCTCYSDEYARRLTWTNQFYEERTKSKNGWDTHSIFKNLLISHYIFLQLHIWLYSFRKTLIKHFTILSHNSRNRCNIQTNFCIIYCNSPGIFRTFIRKLNQYNLICAHAKYNQWLVLNVQT